MVLNEQFCLNLGLEGYKDLLSMKEREHHITRHKAVSRKRRRKRHPHKQKSKKQRVNTDESAVKPSKEERRKKWEQEQALKKAIRKAKRLKYNESSEDESSEDYDNEGKSWMRRIAVKKRCIVIQRMHQKTKNRI